MPTHPPTQETVGGAPAHQKLRRVQLEWSSSRHTIWASIGCRSVGDPSWRPLLVRCGQLQKQGRVNRLRQRNQWRRHELQLRSTIGDRHRRSRTHAGAVTDSHASSCRERAADDAGNKGDSEDVIGEMSGRSPTDLGDVANKGYRSTVSTSKSERTRFGDSCSNDY